MTEPHDWPIERPAKGSLLPWTFSAMGHIAVMFRDAAEAERAEHGLREHGVPAGDIRLYRSKEILSIESRRQEERSTLAKAIAALTADHSARQRYLDNARAGGAALWLFAPTEDRADRLVGLLADFRYVGLRYFGDEGVRDIRRDPD